MAAVCIVGMHRSGTSMVSHILYECGLYLGPREKWEGTHASNPDGFWEHLDFLKINDEILASFDGTWDYPPNFPVNWHRSLFLKDIRERAENLIAGFSDREVWGWKDPRNSLTLPFWREIIPDLRIVHCIRSPIEVCKSLRKRNPHSERFDSNLWNQYVTSILTNVENNPHLVTNYHNYFLQPLNEISRIVEFTGLSLTRDEIQRIAALVIKPSLFNQDSSLEELLSMPDSTKDLYMNLCRVSDQRLNQMITELDTTAISSQITCIHIYEKEQQVQILAARVAKKEQQLQVLTTRVAEQDQQILALTLQARELSIIKSRRAWRLFQMIDKIRFWLLSVRDKS